jgi:hypothetical protein
MSTERDLAIARAVDQHYQWRNSPLAPEVIEALIASVARAEGGDANSGDAGRNSQSSNMTSGVSGPSPLSSGEQPSVNPAKVAEPPSLELSAEDSRLLDAWSAGYKRGRRARVERAVGIIRKIARPLQDYVTKWGVTWPAIAEPLRNASAFLSEWDAEKEEKP